MMGTSFLLLLFFLAVTALTFWISMIVECATKEPSQGNDKIVWILIIIFAQLIGALIYYFVRRPQRISQYGIDGRLCSPPSFVTSKPGIVKP